MCVCVCGINANGWQIHSQSRFGWFKGRPMFIILSSERVDSIDMTAS